MKFFSKKQETETKKKQAAQEELGIETYEAQQIVTRQQTELDNRITECQNITAAREEMEMQFVETEKQYKESVNQLMEAERKGLFLN